MIIKKKRILGGLYGRCFLLLSFWDVALFCKFQQLDFYDNCIFRIFERCSVESLILMDNFVGQIPVLLLLSSYTFSTELFFKSLFASLRSLSFCFETYTCMNFFNLKASVFLLYSLMLIDIFSLLAWGTAASFNFAMSRFDFEAMKLV